MFAASRKTPTALAEWLQDLFLQTICPLTGSLAHATWPGTGCLLPTEAPAYRQPSWASLLLSCLRPRGRDLHARSVRSTSQTGNADSSFAATVCSLALPHPTPHSRAERL